MGWTLDPTAARADRHRRSALRAARAHPCAPRSTRARTPARRFCGGPAGDRRSRSSRPSTRSVRRGSSRSHMAEHLLIGDLAPLLVALGLSRQLVRPALGRPMARPGARADATPRRPAALGREPAGAGTSPGCTTPRSATMSCTRWSTPASSRAGCCSGPRSSGCYPGLAGSGAAAPGGARLRLGHRRVRLPMCSSGAIAPSIRRTSTRCGRGAVPHSPISARGAA